MKKHVDMTTRLRYVKTLRLTVNRMNCMEIIRVQNDYPLLKKVDKIII
jgi:hypothetical protein